MKLKTRKQAPFATVHFESAQYATKIRKHLIPYLDTVVETSAIARPIKIESSLSYVLDYSIEPNEVLVSIYQEENTKLKPYALNPEQRLHMGLLNSDVRMLSAHCFGIKNSRLLQALIQSEQTFFKLTSLLPLHWIKPRSILFNWQFQPNGAQELIHDEEGVRFFSIEQPIFFDSKTGACGLMQTNVPRSFLIHYASIQSYYPSMVEELTEICQQYGLPLPEKINAKKVNPRHPIPCLTLYGASDSKLSEGLLPAAELSFDYHVGNINLFYPEPYIYYQSEGQWFYFERDQTLEETYMRQLDELPVHFYHPWASHLPEMQASEFSQSIELWEKSIESLLASGWHLDIAFDFPISLKNKNPFSLEGVINER